MFNIVVKTDESRVMFKLESEHWSARLTVREDGTMRKVYSFTSKDWESRATRGLDLLTEAYFRLKNKIYTYDHNAWLSDLESLISEGI